MSRELRQSTAVTIKFGPMVDEDDGKTAETALTIEDTDIYLSKNGGTMAVKNDITDASHDALGYYAITLDATDTGTLGSLEIMVHESGALPRKEYFKVVTANYWDSKYGTDKLEVDVQQWIGQTALAVVNGSPVVTLGATQDAYPPSKAGDAMTLTSAYDAAKTAASAQNVWEYSTRGLTDKAGFALAQGFPANFADLAISVLGKVTVGANDDKTGYSLAVTPPTASEIAAAVWGAGTRTLSSFETLVADIWAHATRSLTEKTGFALTADYDAAKTAASPQNVWEYSARGLTDKIGFSLTQAFPANFADLAISALGKVTVGTNDDKTGYSLVSALSAQDVWGYATRSLTDKAGFSLAQTFPANFEDLAITALGKITVGTNDDKTGYSLTVTPPTAPEIAAAVWSAGTRTLSSFGTLVADIWAHATRSLTEKTGFSLTADYDAAKTAAAPGAKMDIVDAPNSTGLAAIADAILTRDWSQVTYTGTVRCLLTACQLLRNYWYVLTGTLHVHKEDDTTESWTATVSTSASADPITGMNP